jgi:hypothetical protein
MATRILTEAMRLAANVTLCAVLALVGCWVLGLPVPVPF